MRTAFRLLTRPLRAAAREGKAAMRISPLFAGVFLFAAPLSGQTVALHDEGTSAAQLEFEALKLHNQPTEYARAADLYLEASVRRLPTDPVVVHDRRMAARLLFYAGDDRAAETMESAGEAALRMGDVIEAAEAFLDAAWLAMEREDIPEVERLAERAETLMASPLVSDAQKADVLDRVERRGGFLNVRRGLP